MKTTPDQRADLLEAAGAFLICAGLFLVIGLGVALIAGGLMIIVKANFGGPPNAGTT